uniref:Universal stress protein n=1 Tax=Roseihalotalea indica TaxID=2867963 RepID=A0AA49GKC8_9BACT|nr:universal stress protein [Tunicatimonas sp. TK19036]
MFKKLAIALAFSPRFEALLHEAKRVRDIFDAQLVIIHVGMQDGGKERLLQQKLKKIGFQEDQVTVIWKQGEPSRKILAVCRREKVDLLIAGAMKKENIFRYYIGSVARKILRKADCSVLMLINPSINPQPFKKIVINGGENDYLLSILKKGCEFGKIEKAAHIHVLREVRMYGLAMAVAGEEGNEDEYTETRRRLLEDEIRKVNSLLQRIDTSTLNINVKVFAGKPEHEIAKFSKRIEADLLILGAPDHKLSLIDRIFPHDLEFLLADLPSNLLVVHQK